MNSGENKGSASKGQNEVVVENILNVIEEHLDAQIEKLDKLDKDDIQQMRDQRLAAMKREANQMKLYVENGHGSYDEIDERTFFIAAKISDLFIIHFYLPTTKRCEILDFHLKLLASKHMETRFVKMHAEQCAFLSDKLNIKVIPTIVTVKKCMLGDRIIGFEELGNCDDFSTEMLEWRLAKAGAISYEGDVTFPPEKKRMGQKMRAYIKRTGTIRELSDSDSDSDGW